MGMPLWEQEIKWGREAGGDLRVSLQLGDTVRAEWLLINVIKQRHMVACPSPQQNLGVVLGSVTSSHLKITPWALL